MPIHAPVITADQPEEKKDCRGRMDPRSAGTYAGANISHSHKTARAMDTGMLIGRFDAIYDGLQDDSAGV